MRIICIQSCIILLLCFHSYAQEDSCELQKEAAKNYASHIYEKDKYYMHSFLLGTVFPLAGPIAVETKALIADVKPIGDSAQSFTTSKCFEDEYVKRVKVERSKEVLKGALIGAGASVFVYGIVFLVIGSMTGGFGDLGGLRIMGE